MIRWSFLFLTLVLAAGCVATEPKQETVPVSADEMEETRKEYEHLQSQIAAKDRQISELEGTLAEIERLAGKDSRSGADSDEDALRKLAEQAGKLAARIKELEQEIGATSEEAQKAAERLLVEAQLFERDNPTEAKSIIATKYKAVFERYPLTKAAKEAKKRYEELSE